MNLASYILKKSEAVILLNNVDIFDYHFANRIIINDCLISESISHM